MSRYIDADALCEALMTRWNTADKNAEKLISEVMADIVTPIVVNMPTADVVEVVRCKDCDFFRGNAQEGGCQLNKLFVKAVKADDYCSRWESTSIFKSSEREWR